MLIAGTSLDLLGQLAYRREMPIEGLVNEAGQRRFADKSRQA